MILKLTKQIHGQSQFGAVRYFPMRADDEGFCPSRVRTKPFLFVWLSGIRPLFLLLAVTPEANASFLCTPYIITAQSVY